MFNRILFSCILVFLFFAISAKAQVSDTCLTVKTEVVTPVVLEAEGAEILVRFTLPPGCFALDTIKIISVERNDTLVQNSNDYRNASTSTEAVFMPGDSVAFSRIPVTNDNDIEPVEERFFASLLINQTDPQYRFSVGSESIEFTITDDDNSPENKKFTLTYFGGIQEGDPLQIQLNFVGGKRFSERLKFRFEPIDTLYGALQDKDYSVSINDIPPFGTSTTIDISTIADFLIEGEEFITGRIVVYDAAWDDPTTYTSLNNVSISILDRDNLRDNRVIEVTSSSDELSEGGKINYSFKIKSPYNIERPLTITLQSENLPDFVNISQTSIILSEHIADWPIEFHYPDNENIDIEQIISGLLSAEDFHTGEFTFLLNNSVVNSLKAQTLDNDSDITVPNAFTPNGDGINDTWVIKGIENNKSSLVQVYNRNGENVFEARVYGNDWNGRKNNKLLPAGVYYYKIFHQKNYPVRTGTLTIMY